MIGEPPNAFDEVGPKAEIRIVLVLDDPSYAAQDRVAFQRDEVGFDRVTVSELARRFGSADSPGFVNGVLDRVGKETSSSEEAAPSLPAEGPQQPAS